MKVSQPLYTDRKCPNFRRHYRTCTGPRNRCSSGARTWSSGRTSGDNHSSGSWQRNCQRASRATDRPLLLSDVSWCVLPEAWKSRWEPECTFSQGITRPRPREHSASMCGAVTGLLLSLQLQRSSWNNWRLTWFKIIFKPLFFIYYNIKFILKSVPFTPESAKPLQGRSARRSAAWTRIERFSSFARSDFSQNISLWSWWRTKTELKATRGLLVKSIRYSKQQTKDFDRIIWTFSPISKGIIHKSWWN